MTIAPDDLAVLTKLVKEHEGFSPVPYKDTEGLLTIGFGRLIEPDRGGGISVSEGELMLANDLAKCDADLQGFGWYRGLAGPRKVACIEMRFQLGAAGFRGFKAMLAHIADGNWALAATEALDSRWAKQTPKRAQAVAAMLENEVYP